MVENTIVRSGPAFASFIEMSTDALPVSARDCESIWRSRGATFFARRSSVCSYSSRVRVRLYSAARRFRAYSDCTPEPSRHASGVPFEPAPIRAPFEAGSVAHHALNHVQRHPHLVHHLAAGLALPHEVRNPVLDLRRGLHTRRHGSAHVHGARDDQAVESPDVAVHVTGRICDPADSRRGVC